MRKHFLTMISMLAVLFSLPACKAVLPSGQYAPADSPNPQVSGEQNREGPSAMEIELVMKNKTSYSYTPLGRVDDSEGLAAALGDGGVQVRIRSIPLS